MQLAKIASLLVLALGFTSCAQVTVKKTYVATGALNPEAIYVRPFDTSKMVVRGDHGWDGERAIHGSRAANDFAHVLTQELSKIAPAAQITESEVPTSGWIVDGEIDLLDGGLRAARGMVGFLGFGRSTVKMHVTVTDAATGRTEYAFDISGGSGLTGPAGNTGAPGIGDARWFDYHNAAQRIMLTLHPDPKNQGVRSAP